ncbi:heat-inducible transcriptional repressor HrcA [Halarsenatibacter silvermanii]|uniref:Heat-inducible transcription repressor HrcA n=1 Tax=Halarsenatibacter silvermanii TaxID=321763 RepID=A0A1G9JWM2_9FIRM|nr:heat-inducible transcriptional repressor HrcA [Halarsenatibacter silvermanii]SDL41898.1 heat-inducible transcription repressor HrcA [Halarsenatibacter silvermanii]
MKEQVSDRQKEVLLAIIEQHILTAEPVGSRTLAREYDLGFSPATVRNEMADLEEMGLVEQPHTSAGRVPSDLGYRFYVDNLLASDFKKPESITKYLKKLSQKKSGLEDIMSGMARMLSQMTQYTALLSEPGFSAGKISRLELFPVNKRRLLLVLITDAGLVTNKVIPLKEELTEEQIEDLKIVLAKRIIDKNIDDIDEEFLQSLEQELKRRLNYTEQIISVLQEELNKVLSQEEMKVYLEGTNYILEQPEFNDISDLKQIMKVLDKEENLRELLQGLEEELDVKIGREIHLEEMQNCSLVYATYQLSDQARGKLGILGPTRMKYVQAISAVDLASELLSQIISSTGR